VSETRRLRDAAEMLRTASRDHYAEQPLNSAVCTGIADWLEATAHDAAYTARGLALEHAHRIADAVLRSGETKNAESVRDGAA